MQSDEEIIILSKLWYYSNEVCSLLELHKSKFEREIRKHRRALGPKKGMTWSSNQVKQIIYIIAPHIHVDIRH